MSSGLVGKALKNLDEFVRTLFFDDNGMPLRLTDYQRRFIEAVIKREHGKYIFLASTRAGKTTSTAVLAVLMAILYPREEIVVVAPTFRQTQILWKKIRAHFENNPVLYMMLDMAKGYSRDTIHLKNGTVMRAISAANPEGLLGYGATVLIVDEAGSIPDDVFRTRILRMISSAKRKPVLILLGTPHITNYFYDAWRSDDFFKIRVTWRDAVKAGIMREEEVEFQRKIMRESEFRTWYEAEFVSADNEFFDLADVKEIAVGSVRREKKKLPGFRYYAGLDVARLGSDWTVLTIVEVPEQFSFENGTAEVVAVYILRKGYISDVVKWAYRHIMDWKPDAVAVDCVALGAGVADILRERLGGFIRCVGDTGNERNEMYLFLRRLVMERRLIIPKDEELIEQFRSYKIKTRQDGRIQIVKAHGKRDDFVDALALAVYLSAKRNEGVVAVFDSMDDFLNNTVLSNKTP